MSTNVLFNKERDVEEYLIRQVKRLGGRALKLVCPGVAGVPDRLILLPGGRVCFCELKASGKKARPLQLHQHEQLRNMGFDVFVCDDRLKVDLMIEGMQGTE
jgi:hypothetical protein